MTDTTWRGLRQLLVDHYDVFRKRLTRSLGSDDLAREALHEAWLRLHREDAAATLDRPFGFVLRTAHNIATDQARKEGRLARRIDLREVLDCASEAPSPAQEVEARAEITALEQAIDELTPRRRTILLASRLDGQPLRQIAERLGVTQRLVEMELKHAVEHCAERLDRKITRRFGPRPRESSEG